jgi:hypothetical protein
MGLGTSLEWPSLVQYSKLKYRRPKPSMPAWNIRVPSVSTHVTAISQHVKKARKVCLQGKALTGDDDNDDGDDGQARGGGTAIAVVGTEAGGGQGIMCTMRDEICIAYGVLMIYLVKRAEPE